MSSKHSQEIGIDVGYSSCKINYMDKVVKFPTAISFSTDLGITYGEDNVYDFEGEKYYVGKEAVGSESFTTNDYKFLYKFAPLLIFHILSKFEQTELKEPLIVKTGLAMVDWNKKDEFYERISNFTVNGINITTQPVLIPQGAGCIMDWVHNDNDDDFPHRIVALDIGYNTINLVSFLEGKPVRKEMKSYPGHGVSSIIKPFTSFMENNYAMNFSEQEVINIFLRGEFKYNGELQEDLKDKITVLKEQFVKKLFQSVLINDKKTMAISDIVLIGGGGAYMLQDTPFPPNVEFVSLPYEFSNCRGYSI